MATNRGFNLRFDRMRENDPTSESAEKQESEALYAAPGHIRNVCFAWPDGKRLFLNYAYLVSCAFESDGETNTINLIFTSHHVTLKGFQLEDLFLALMEQLPRIIEREDERYRQTSDGGPVVTEILVSNPDA